jgi:hypothetical protein
MEPNKTNSVSPARQEAVDHLLEKLPTMDRSELLKLWRELFARVPSPALHKEMLIPILAYRIQEKAFGGLSESTTRKLQQLAEASAPGKNRLRPRIGTRYMREYQGKLHEVTVLDIGFEYQDRSYRSLTEIAKIITGSKRSGPEFFGVIRKSRKALA